MTDWAEKDAEFAKRKAAGEWPADTCDSCTLRGSCCNWIWHHVGDCCLHCGNDERDIQPIARKKRRAG